MKRQWLSHASQFRTRHISLFAIGGSARKTKTQTTTLYTRVHEIFGHVPSAVFPRDFAWWVEISSFSFLRYREVVGATLAFLVSGPPVFIAIFRDSEIASTATIKRTPSFAARWPNSSQKLLLYSEHQLDFRDWKNIAPSPRYGDFSENGPEIHRATQGCRQPKTDKLHLNSCWRPSKPPSSTKLGMWLEYTQDQLPNTFRKIFCKSDTVKMRENAPVDAHFTHFFTSVAI